MSKLSNVLPTICLLLAVFGSSSCMAYPNDVLLVESTNEVVTFSDGDFETIFWLNDKSDLDRSVLSPAEYVSIQRFVFERTKHESYRSINVWLCSDNETWLSMATIDDPDRSASKTAGIYTRSSDIVDEIVYLNPATWDKGSRKYSAEVYIHELFHSIDYDAKHTDQTVWGPKGLVLSYAQQWVESYEAEKGSK